MKAQASDWFDYQAEKILPKEPRRPAAKVETPVAAPMEVEESTASDTAIERIIRQYGHD